MKKYLLLSIVTTVVLANSNSEDLIVEYKKMFEKIGEKRIGVDEGRIDALKTPFVTIAKKETTSKNDTKIKTKSFVLQAIVNKRAKISGKWYKLYGQVHGMKIISVRDNYVWLKNDEFRKKLILGRKNEKISIK